MKAESNRPRVLPGGVCLALLVFWLSLAWTGAAPRANDIISGYALRPFPMLMPLDYDSCRARAWLAALDKALATLPGYVNLRLREHGLDGRLGKLAVCALAFPVDVVTPEISQTDRITVYLRAPRDRVSECAKILRDPAALLLEICLVSETEASLSHLSAIWPRSLAEARGKIAALEEISGNLSALWDIARINSSLAQGQSRPGYAIFSGIAAKGATSPLARLEEAQSLFGEDRPQNALEAASVAARQARIMLEAGNAPALPWSFLLARSLYYRGLAHWRLDQTALAEADLDAAYEVLSPHEHSYGELPRILQARGALRGLRRDMRAMCADLEEACVMGGCEGLVEARGMGRCPPP